MPSSTHSPSPASLRSALTPFGGLWPESDRVLARLMHALAAHLSQAATAWRGGLRRRQAARQLLDLDDRALRDIGYTRSDVIWYSITHRPDPDLRAR